MEESGCRCVYKITTPSSPWQLAIVAMLAICKCNVFTKAYISILGKVNCQVRWSISRPYFKLWFKFSSIISQLFCCSQNDIAAFSTRVYQGSKDRLPISCHGGHPDPMVFKAEDDSVLLSQQGWFQAGLQLLFTSLFLSVYKVSHI